MKTVVVKRTMPCSASEFFDHLRQTKNLRYIARPYVTYDFDAKRYPVWNEGMKLNIKPTLQLFGRTKPLGDHLVSITRVDADALIIETKEHGGTITRWDHTMEVKPIDESSCEYSDSIMLEAGYQTLLVTKFATLFYRHRQRRWQEMLNKHLIAA